MKLQKIFALCFVLSLSIVASAQHIYFSDTSNKWKTSFTAYPDGPPGTTIIRNYQFEDTVVTEYGQDYLLLNYENGVLVREDTQARKVYIRPLPGTLEQRLDPTDTNEFVYLDYNLAVGDTLKMPYVPPYTQNGDTSYHIVQQIDSIPMNNAYYKVFTITAYFPDHEWPTHYEVIEGIGTSTGPVFIPDGLGEWSTRLICFKNRDTIPCSLYSTCSDVISIPEVKGKAVYFEVIPNPASDRIRLRYLGQQSGKAEVHITDLTGKVLSVFSFRQEVEYNIGHLPAGFYLLQLREKGKLLQCNKLVVRD